jgi:multiple sugar transport system substrate-binding protein
MQRDTRLVLAAVLPALGLVSTPAMAIDWQRFAGSEITVLIAEHPVANGIRELLPEFEEATGISVDVQAFAEDLYFDRMELALRATEGVADVYFLPMDSTAFTQWSAGLIQPLTPFLDDPELTAEDYGLGDFPAGFLAATQYPPGDADAEDYAIPVSFESYILFYNKDHVDAYLDGAVPATMPELIEAAATISEKSGGQVAGAVMRGIRSDTPIDTVTGIVYNAWGAEPTPLPYNVWFDGDWSKPRLTDPRIAAGLSHYAGMMKAGPPNILALDWPDASLLFQQGRAGFFIDASLFGPGFENPEESQVAGKTGYATLPPADAGGGSFTGHWMWGLGIPANAAEPDAAWYFIQWMTSKSAEPRIGAMHGGAARLSTWDDAGYKAELNPDYVKVVQDSMRTSRSTVVFREGWAEYALAIVDAIHEIHGGATPEAATEALQARFLEMLNP